jgi:three-Cys-motif partner protein
VSEEYWKYNEHTSYKHSILNYYLRLWSSILGSASKELVVWDCFAGRGTYAGGQPGSPLHMLEESQRCWNSERQVKLSCVFIERDRNNFEELQTTLRKLYPELENDRWFVYNSDYLDIFNGAIDGEIEELKNLIKKPALFFLDPIGFKGLPLTAIREMMSRSSCEILITLMVESIKRHRNTPSVVQHFKKMFGVDEIERLNDICSDSKPEAKIAEYYEERLKSPDGANIRYTLSFPFTPNRRDVVLYYLVFGSNHRAGLDAMHRTMRAVSKNPESLSYRGKRNGIASLEYYMGDPQQVIADWILSLPLSIENLKTITHRAALLKKPYSHPQIRKAIVQLIQGGKLEFVPKDDKAKEKGVIGKRYFRFV